MRLTVTRFVGGAFVAFLSVVSASAADLRPVYKAPAYLDPAPIFSWTGFYIGAHAGYGWSRLSGSGTFGTGSADLKGFLAGGQIGYNYQFGQYVVGIEGEYSWADVEHEEALFAGTLSVKNDYFITAAARLGYAFDRFLVYGKLGGAWTRDKWDANDGLGGTATGNFNRNGWLFGVGAEYALTNNWSAKLEYNYLRFPSISPTLMTTGGLVVTGAGDIKLDTHIVKAGINYRFNAF